MRALVVHPGPAWATADVYRGWVRGLIANGVNVREFNLDDRLAFYSNSGIVIPTERCDSCGRDDEFVKWFDSDADVVRAVGQGLHAACYQFDPDVVLVISAAFLPAYVYDVIRQRSRTKVVIVHTESPYEDERQMLLAGHADVHLLNDPTNLERWRTVNASTWYVPHSYDPTVHTPGPSRFDHDVVWVGTAGNTFESRTRFMERVDWSGIDVGLGGLWQGLDDDSPLVPLVMDGMGECVDNDVTVELLRGARMTFNLYRSDGIDGSFAGGWAMGPREVEAVSTGCFMARHSPPNHGGEGDEILPMLPRFTDPDELGDIVRHYLAHPDRRTELAAAARAAVADRTFEHHAADLLRRLNP